MTKFSKFNESFSKDVPLRAESTEPELKHRVSVTISDPQHSMVSKRGEKTEKKIRLYAKDEKHAQELAKHHFKKQGYKVHDSNYIGVVEETENVNEVSANTAMSYLHKTYDTKGYRDHTPQTKKGIERATRKVSRDAMRKDYERSSKLGLSTEEVERVDEVSMGLLTRYKEKAGQQASAMNKAIPSVASSSAAPEHKKAAIDALVKKGNKRFSGIIKATNKQFAKATTKEEVEIIEAVSVKKQNYSWGKMVTVHDGSRTSYPLHPKHQKELSKLRDGDKTSFKDETGRQVHAHREGDKVHLMTKDGGYKPTTVPFHHFNEQVDNPPFEGGKKTQGTVTDKSGAKHTAMSRAKHLAKMAASKEKKAVKGFKKFSEK